MPDLKTNYLGFTLPHPFIVGASPLVYNIDTAKALEDAGAAAIVMHSLFEEQIVRENVRGFPGAENDESGLFPEAGSFPLHPDSYLNHIEKLKSHLDIPVIASINGIHDGSWVEFARQMANAGADAIELNLYFLPKMDSDSSADVERRALRIVKKVKDDLSLPLSVKISPFYTSLPKFVSRLEESGADAITLFNSFFQPEIDIENIAYKSQISFSDSSELLLRTRWAATLYGRTNLAISISGGIHSAPDAVKAQMAGATSLQVVSCLMENGPSYLETLIQDFKTWMREHEFESVDQLRGILSFMHCSNTEALARAGYLKTLQEWRQS